MKLKVPFILKAVGVTALVLFATVALIGCWITRTEDVCWRNEAVEAFQKYGALKGRMEILRVAGVEKDPGSNPVEVIEKDPNG